MMETAVPDCTELVEIHGRLFQKYSVENRIYCVPIDDEEEERQDLQHRLFDQIFEERLFFPPIQYPRRILDCGYGFGSWAVQMAQTYGESEITAVDIYPADLEDEPENLERHVWNLNDPLIPTYERGYYDLIHSRCVTAGIKTTRWPGYVHDLRRLLRRDGWVQLVEYHYLIQSHSGLLNDNSALRRWWQAYQGVMGSTLDRDARSGSRLAGRLRDAGLRDVQTREYQVPIGSWPTDLRQRSIGAWNLANIESMLDSHSLWPFTSVAGWSKEQVGYLTEPAKAEARNPKFRLYISLYVAWGKKQ